MSKENLVFGGSAEEWEKRYSELSAVHNVFCVAIRKALGITCPVPLSDILETAIAMKAFSDKNWKSKYGNVAKDELSESTHSLIKFSVARDFSDDLIDLRIEVIDYTPADNKVGWGCEKFPASVELGRAFVAATGEPFELTDREMDSAEEAAIEQIENPDED